MSTFVLKIIASMAMLADHIGYFSNYGFETAGGIMRAVGRIAFPIYCYLIAFGFRKTHNKYAYLLRLAVFALISEVPFNYCFYGRAEFALHNVYYTLALGLIGLIIYDKMSGSRHAAVRFLSILPVALCVTAAEWLECDYSGYGVALIFLFYLAGNSRLFAGFACILFAFRKVVEAIIAAMLGGFVMPVISQWDWVSVFAAAAAIPIIFCNGSRAPYPKSKVGRIVQKYAFYAFYPLHILIIGLIMRAYVIK